ncbi:UDP-3-O-(3-hydroxymyristoyl)glucosamine N-acyltransferase [Crenalkalicoccus roseus]|uniref:UDP-3-O-(3-hydroxymyristoyl)glucosamine N-acyltransferase n=1 Tax=Crenalkalicoccus roseus TaxID=1485588 RepID=UPI001081A0C0|nr:UDP-3-O-(3-hydroxymyristoyl)glucosamine N-acyltransferase [Crenalkalicoccus roseus]
MAADPRFFASTGPHRLSAIAAAAGGRVEGDESRLFSGVAPLQEAGPEHVSFLDNRRYVEALRATRAGAVVLAPAMQGALPAGAAAILTETPYLGFARVARLFHPPPAPVPGIHPTAVIGEEAVIGEGVEIGPYVVVGARARIGRGCVLHAHVVVGPGVELGEECRLHPHSSITHAIAGRGVVLHPGARVGQEGFGFALTPDGGYETMPQLGRVILEDFVEVGANACVDRGSQGDTVLGRCSRLDNLVQIGHNVRTGAGCVMVAQSGISGSTLLGNHVMVAAQAGLVGHLRIGDKARIGAQAGVMEDVPAGADVLGSPAWPVREFWRAIVRLRQLGRAAARAGHKAG